MSKSGPFMSAYLSPSILYSDFNEDGFADAVVILTVSYTGIGYFNQLVFVVLQDYQNGPRVTNEVIVGEVAVYTVDGFSIDKTGKKIILEFMDRLPGQPKAIAPSVPTVVTLRVEGKSLVVDSKKTFAKECEHVKV